MKAGLFGEVKRDCKAALKNQKNWTTTGEMATHPASRHKRKFTQLEG
jgi:hypothetical protein